MNASEAQVRNRRRVLTAAGLIVSAISIVAAAGCASEHGIAVRPSPLSNHYRDPIGWSLSYPPEMHLEHSKVISRLFIREVTVANFAPRRAIRSGSSPNGSWIAVDPPKPKDGSFPADGIAFRVYRQEGGPFILPGSNPEERMPMRLAELARDDVEYPGTRPRPLAKSITAGGVGYKVYAWIGPKASARDRSALEEIVSSLTFPHLEPGTTAGYFMVLDQAGLYPTGSFTRVRSHGQPFYLVHAPGGFYGISWSDYTSQGYKPRCAMQVDPAAKQFYCSHKPYRWNRMGQPAAFPPGWKPYPLKVALAKVSWDGHVLLAPGVDAYGDRVLARRLWSHAHA